MRTTWKAIEKTCDSWIRQSKKIQGICGKVPEHEQGSTNHRRWLLTPANKL